MSAADMVAAVRAKVERCRGHWPAVMRKARVSRSWLSQFSRGGITDPRVGTLQSVSEACDEVIGIIDQLKAP
jgi:hypothetical protein